MGTAGADLEKERLRYRKKIKEWSRLGFNTDGLEELLDTDFAAFLKRKSQVLLGQIKGEDEAPSEPETPKSEESPPEPELPKEEEPQPVVLPPRP